MDFSQGKARSVDEIIEIANDHPHSNIRFDFVLEGGYLLHFCEKVERLCEHPNVINRLSLLYLGYRVTPPQASEFIDIVANVRPQPCFGFEIDPYYLWFPRDVQALNENTNAQKCLKELCILKFGVALDISKLVNLETLNVSTVENNPNILSGLINLRTLSFGQRTNIDLKTLVQYNKLKKIVLNEFNNQDLAELPTLENITELEEIFCNISEFGWLSKLPNLKKLKLDYAQNQDHTTLPMLVKLRELGLFVKGLSQLNVIFERGPNLEDLSLFYCESGAFDSLPNLENLRKVYIDSQNVSINDIKALLSKGPSLQEIRLSRTQVTPAEIEALQLERKAQRLREVAIVKH
ncbi:MAG: hypothetical protein A2007_04560 [Verrucomicrobia bacterium GWC2_42_7]|nr:MAG: hypothetical protein A2007_04560 [Verrucomicrobia bacterium GWC2_42_7]